MKPRSSRPRAAVDHQERRELQRLAKLRGIKANQKTQVLVEELGRRLAAYDAGARSATPPPPAVPVPVPVPASMPARRRNAQAPAYQLEIPNLDEPLPPPTAPTRRQRQRRQRTARAAAATVAAALCGFALLRRASDAPPAPPPAPRSAMTQAIGEALAGARDAGRVARELDAFVGVWDAPRSRHAAALVMAGDGDRVARAARALAASPRARVLWAAEPVDWRAVKRHLYDARRHGARALVVVDGCDASARGPPTPRRGPPRARSTRCGRRLSIWACPARRRSRWATRPSSGRSPTRARARARSGPPSRRSARAGVPTCRTRGGPRALLGGGLRRTPILVRPNVTLAALDRGGELVRHLRVLADGLLLELEAHGDARRFVGRVERPREAGGLCCVTNHRRCASLSMRGHIRRNAGRRATHGEHAQGLGRGFYCVRIHRVSLWCSSKPSSSSSCTRGGSD